MRHLKKHYFVGFMMLGILTGREVMGQNSPTAVKPVTPPPAAVVQFTPLTEINAAYSAASAVERRGFEVSEDAHHYGFVRQRGIEGYTVVVDGKFTGPVYDKISPQLVDIRNEAEGTPTIPNVDPGSIMMMRQDWEPTNSDRLFHFAFFSGNADFSRVIYRAERGKKHFLVFQAGDKSEQIELGEYKNVIAASPDLKKFVYMDWVAGEEDRSAHLEVIMEPGHLSLGKPQFEGTSVRFSEDSAHWLSEIDGQQLLDGAPLPNGGPGAWFSKDLMSHVYGSDGREHFSVHGVAGPLLDRKFNISITEDSFVTSPDGKRYAYIDGGGDGKECVVVDGKAEEHHYDQIVHLTFSPDSKKFGYIAHQHDKYALIIDGEQKDISDHGVKWFGWSKDGGHFAAIVNGIARSSLMIDNQPHYVHNAFEGLDHLAFTDDGKHLVGWSLMTGGVNVSVDGGFVSVVGTIGVWHFQRSNNELSFYQLTANGYRLVEVNF